MNSLSEYKKSNSQIRDLLFPERNHDYDSTSSDSRINKVIVNSDRSSSIDIGVQFPSSQYFGFKIFRFGHKPYYIDDGKVLLKKPERNSEPIKSRRNDRYNTADLHAPNQVEENERITTSRRARLNSEINNSTDNYAIPQSKRLSQEKIVQLRHHTEKQVLSGAGHNMMCNSLQPKEGQNTCYRKKNIDKM